MFLYLGIGLIILSLAVLPLTVSENVMPLYSADYPDYVDFKVGFLLAPMIGSFGIISLALGIAEASATKKQAFLRLLPIFSIVYIWTLFNILQSFPFVITPIFWWIPAYFPTITISVIGLLQLIRKDAMDRALKNRAIRMGLFSILLVIPLLYVVSILFLLH